MRYISDASSKNLTAFIQDVIEPQSTVCTDGWVGYTQLESIGYKCV